MRVGIIARLAGLGAALGIAASHLVGCDAGDTLLVFPPGQDPNINVVGNGNQVGDNQTITNPTPAPTATPTATPNGGSNG